MIAVLEAGTAVTMGAVLAVGVAGEALAAARRWRRRRHEHGRGGVTTGTSPLAVEVWARRLSYGAYLATASRNRDILDEVYRQPSYEEADLAWLRGLPPLRVLAIAEDWCPDVVHTLPTWARLVQELPGWELGVFSRDANLDVMEAFLADGERRRIPVYAFYLGDRLQVWWSGRSAAAERHLADILAARGVADLAGLAESERRRAVQLIEDGYRRDLRRQTFEEVLALLHAFFHVAA